MSKLIKFRIIAVLVSTHPAQKIWDTIFSCALSIEAATVDILPSSDRSAMNVEWQCKSMGGTKLLLAVRGFSL
jgi:hypothetical protein